MRNITSVKSDCCGCEVCLNICPKSAITMNTDENGFKYPVVADKSKCTNCGLCLKSCPVLKEETHNTIKPKCFAIMSDTKIRLNSTSGGVFFELAKHFIDTNGYVCSAIWDKCWNVNHIVSNNIKDIQKMMGSKYLQSDIKNCYQEIKILLEDNKNVLFTGTPCQVSGLKSFLKKDFNNLYCVDIVCHGVPSSAVFKKYLDKKLKQDEIIEKISFREKTPCWNPYSLLVKTNKNTYLTNKKEDEYLRAFIAGLSIRESCGNCKFANINRMGDITLGDFWGIWEYKKSFNDNKGTSLVLVNTNKGEKLLQSTSKSYKLFEKAPINIAKKHNKNLNKSSILHPQRDKFFELIKNTSIKEAVSICLDNKCDCMITNLWRTVNYGAVLTCYGVQCLLESFSLKLTKSLSNIYVLKDVMHS